MYMMYIAEHEWSAPHAPANAAQARPGSDLSLAACPGRISCLWRRPSWSTAPWLYGLLPHWRNGRFNDLVRTYVAGAFWQRVRDGSRLADAGRGTTQVIEAFDIEAEVVRILANKSGAGRGAHSDYCNVAGRKVNDWLSQPQQIPAFLQALQDAGWIKLGAPRAAPPSAPSRSWLPRAA